MESPDARKAAKAERKAAKNQVLFDVITQEELATVQRSLHPEAEKQLSTIPNGQGLANNRTIDENITFNANTFKWNQLRQDFHAKKVAKNNGGKQRPNTHEQDSEILSPIFAQLGISTVTQFSKANRERKSLDAKLRAAILGDLVAFENDQVEKMQRMAGYWRYTNKRTYNEMVRNNEIWDWATGEKLPEIREDAELDIIDEADENGTKMSEEIHSCTNRIGSEPGCLPVHPLSIKVLPPFSSDEARECLQVEHVDHTKEDCKILNDVSTPRDPLSSTSSDPDSPHEKAFQGVKDTRVFGKAIRKSLAPSKDEPSNPQPIRTPLLAAIQIEDTPDRLNRFGALDHEVPAPCEEVKNVDPPLVQSVLRIPGKPIVKTLTVHDEQDDWKTIWRPKGKKGTKGSPTLAVREQAAVNVRAKKCGGGKNFASVVKRGL